LKKVFIANLPKNEYGKNKGGTNWTKCIGLKISFIYEDIKGLIEIVDYDGRNIYIKYENENYFKIYTGNFKACKLARFLGKITNKFRIEIGQIIKDDRRDLIITDREYREKNEDKGIKQTTRWYKYTCNKCGWTEGWIVEHSILKQKNGCSCCCDSPQVLVEGINDISTTAPWMVKFFQGGYDEAKLYSKTSNKKITPICPDCGRIKDKEMLINNIYNRKSINCFCADSMSYPSKLMFNLLEQFHINFETEYSPDWIKPKRFDFYFELNKNKYIVETDGGWHKKDNNMSGQTADESISVDNFKDLKAIKNNIEVIRIDCELSELELIKNNVLDSKLNSMFDLSKIDWDKAEEFALSNLVKTACDYKKNNSNITIYEIKNLMKLSNTTIRKYLKKGSILGWCDYNPKEEISKNCSKSGKMQGKKVEIFKESISLGIFESCSELERQSNQLFNIKLDLHNISLVCLGKRNHHKGYTFKYVDDEKLIG